MAINAWKKDSRNQTQDKDIHEFTGFFGNGDVTFQGLWARKQNKDAEIPGGYVYEEVELFARGKQIGTLGAQRGIEKLGQTDDYLPTTRVWLVSPAYHDEGVVSEMQQVGKRFLVFHAKDETEDSVIDKICDEVALCKAKFAVKKLRKFKYSAEVAFALRNVRPPHELDDASGLNDILFRS